jgi:hypothetical protein
MANELAKVAKREGIKEKKCTKTETKLEMYRRVFPIATEEQSQECVRIHDEMEAKGMLQPPSEEDETSVSNPQTAYDMLYFLRKP